MVKSRKARPFCDHCGVREVARTDRGPYCGRTCAGLARQKRVKVVCAYCGREEDRRPSEIGASAQNFCTHAHYVAWQRDQVGEFTCLQCGERKRLPRWAKSQMFCGNRCSGLAKRKRVIRTCSVCSATFDCEPNEVASGRGKYCSSACRYAGRRQGCAAEKPCGRAECDQIIRGNRSQVEKRLYCSSACRWGVAGGRSEVTTCQRIGCDKTRRWPYALLKRGFGKFCSRACYRQSKLEARPWLICQRKACLKKPFQVAPSAGSKRRFCSWRCQVLARAPKTFRCPACGEVKLRPAGRHPTFCSGACRNRGRLREREPRVVVRNQHILELAARNMKSPAMAEELQVISETMSGWQLDPAAIRKVISRGK